MTEPYRIRYLSSAEKDLIGIFDYIAKDKPTAAIRQLEKFDASISQLSTNPYLGVIPRDERLKRLLYRMLVIDSYLVFYVVKDEIRAVQIRRVIHGHRQYRFLL